MTLVSIALASLVLAAPAQAPRARLAYQHDGSIWTIAADGSDRHRITNGTEEGAPAWSPDGSQIAFRGRTATGRGGIYAIPAAGGPVRALAEDAEVSAGSPAWSPDGSTIAFDGFRFSEKGAVSTIEVVRADGSGRRTVLALESQALEAVVDPVWMPGGAALAYTRTRVPDGGVRRPEIRVVGLDGGGDRVFLTDAEGGAWSPDGSRFAYGDVAGAAGQTCAEDECFPDADLAIADADGGNRRVLLRTGVSEGEASWSADGGRIAFSSGRNTRRLRFAAPELYSIAPDGSCLTWLTNGSPGSMAPSWSPAAGDSAPGACGARARPPLVEHGLAPGQRPLWLGRRFGQSLLGLVQGTGRNAIVEYVDCAAFLPRDCPPAFLLDQKDACARGPELPFVARNLRRPRRVGGVIVAAQQGDRRGVIFADRAWMHLQVESTSTAAERARLFGRIARRLRTVSGARPGRIVLPAAVRRRLPARLRAGVRTCP